MGAGVDRRLGERVLSALGIWRVGGGGEKHDGGDWILRVEPLSRTVRGGGDGDWISARAGTLAPRLCDGGGGGCARSCVCRAASAAAGCDDRSGKRRVDSRCREDRLAVRAGDRAA